MNLQQFFEDTNEGYYLPDYDPRYQVPKIRPRIFCKDGVSLSVQASEFMYCSPRQNFMPNYFSVEVGYPSIVPPAEWEEYFDGEWQRNYFQRIFKERKSILHALKNIFKRLFGTGDLVSTYRMSFWSLHHHLAFKHNAIRGIYAYIPTELVQEFIDNHGGIDADKTFVFNKEKKE